MRDALERELKTEIPSDDAARVYRVVLGKYTDEIRGIVLSVHGDHPLGFRGQERDSSTGSTSPFPTESDRDWDLPTETIGGARWEKIVGTVQVRGLQDRSPADAIEVIDMVKIRIAQVINNDTDLRNITDDYGYRIFALETARRYGYASGGDSTAVDSHWCDWTAFMTFRRTCA